MRGEEAGGQLKRVVAAVAFAFCATIPAGAAEVCAQNVSESCDGPTRIRVQPISEKGQPNGYPGLDANGLVPSAQLPVGLPGGDPEAFPVGSVFIGVVSTNPNTLLGYGTWSAFGAGRVLVGLDAGQTEFDVAEETGGAKTHTLTAAEMPSHTHTQDPHTHTLTGGATDDTSAPFPGPDAANSATVFATTGIQAATAVNQSTGGGGAHNNLQPYIVVYFWKRTA